MSGVIEQLKVSITSIDRTIEDEQDMAGTPRVPEAWPTDCPVTPLGVNGDTFYYLDAMRQLRPLDAGKHTRLGIQALFGAKSDLLYQYWPRYSAPEKGRRAEIVGWRPELAAEALLRRASESGVLDVTDRVRGPGAWVDEDGGLVMHCGDEIFHGLQRRAPGTIGRYIYPSAPSKPRPSGKPAGPDAGQFLLSLLKSWNWRRPDMDPHLLLGWMCAAMVGGALDWRPLAWVTGDKATGKSTLHKVMQMVFGPGGLLQSSDPTAAGLWQTAGHSSLPIALDEMEAEEDNRKNNNVIKLARQAASGGRIVRGGTDHKASDFTVRNCMLFSSILIPPLLGQDVSRIAILHLDKLGGTDVPHLEPRQLAEIGAALRQRFIDRWADLQSMLFTYRKTINDAGHGGRGADVFGTLLACLHIATNDELPEEEELMQWIELFRKDKLAESEEDIADHERCLQYLMTSPCDVYRSGEKRQIGAYIADASGYNPAAQEADKSHANHALAHHGIKADDMWLYVANSHQGTAQLFANSLWNGKSGTTGVWVQALRRIPGAANGKSNIRFDGVPCRYTQVPIKEVLGERPRRSQRGSTE